MLACWRARMSAAASPVIRASAARPSCTRPVSVPPGLIALMRAYTLLFALSWLPWLLHAQWPFAATLAWFALMGVLIPGFTLTWTIAKEANDPEHSGIATAIVNMGIFLGAGVLQPVVGWVLDRASDPLVAWRDAVSLLAAAAAFGALMAWLVRSPRSHHHPSE